MLTLLAAAVTAFTGCAHHPAVRPASCKPYCAAGHFRTYSLSVHLSRPVRCVHGRTEFSRVAWTYAGAHPAQVPRAGCEVLPCTFLRLKP